MFSTDAWPDNNDVDCSFSASLLPSHLVGRGDNLVDTSGVPGWDYDGIVNIALDITK
jgi:hypothetical protein